jgi:L-ascorbate metabolism protein UlaG (beta-lactamase superfamily)
MKLTWYGHSCFLIEHGGHRILTDPFISGNPSAPIKAADVRCDHIVVSHGHIDHCLDVEAIAKANDALVIGVYELAEHFGRLGCRTHGMYHGGGYTFAFGRATVTQAHHGAGLDSPDGKFLYLGNPAGFVLRLGERNVYFAGDTCVFSDMALIARLHPLDLAMLPIGDNFTMGPEEALVALEFLRPRACVPMHYDTWPLIATDARAFAARTAALGVHTHVPALGQTITP